MPLNPRLTDWQRRRVWLVGASTGIGRATALALAERGAQVCVSARDAQKLQALAHSHAAIDTLAVDVTDSAALQQAAHTVWQRHGAVDLVLFCAGHYRAMQADRFDLAEALRHQQVNLVGALHLLQAVLPALLQQAAAGAPAHLSLVASVAGYRGLPLALGYGPTKAALINLAEVLYQDLRPRGVAVSLVCPGFVDTPLTAQNTFRMPALISPEAAAQALLRGWADGRFEIHFPRRFTRVLKLLQLLPAPLYFWLLRHALGR